MKKDIVVVRGGGDIATGVVHRLYRSGFQVLILEIENPTMVRRTVSFARAIFDGQAVVEDVKAEKAYDVNDVYEIWKKGNIPVLIDSECNILNVIKADVLVDAILAKRNFGTHREMASITIGVGPGFYAGEDVDVVIETRRGHDLGRLIFKGHAKLNTGIPGEILGYGKERVLKAPCDGIISNILDIGDLVKKGETIVFVNKEPVTAEIDGVLRGMIMNHSKVKKGYKIGDIDPRAKREYCFTISDKARSIGGGVLEAILYMKKKMECE